MADFLKKKKNIIILIGIVLGLTGGFLYWKFIGCTSGTCPVTSNWYTSTLFGGIFGYLIADSIKIKDIKQKEKKIDG